jgi:hypothetical protein
LILCLSQIRSVRIRDKIHPGFSSPTRTKHPHIYLIVNRVNPETGVMAKLSKAHIDFSKWAQAYEKAPSKIRCERRVEHNRRREKKEFVKDKSISELQKWRADGLRRAYADP